MIKGLLWKLKNGACPLKATGLIIELLQNSQRSTTLYYLPFRDKIEEFDWKHSIAIRHFVQAVKEGILRYNIDIISWGKL